MKLQELRAMREKAKNEIAARNADGKETQIIVGMGTCGIASGAKETFAEFLNQIEKHNLADSVVLRQTGCMGLCANEPTVEVVSPDMPNVIYGKVKADVAREIVDTHILGKKLLDGHIIDKPSEDIISD